MSENPLHSQEERDKQFNALNAIMVSPCKPLAKVSIASYQQKDLEEAVDELVSIWDALNTIHLSTNNRERLPLLTLKLGATWHNAI